MKYQLTFISCFISLLFFSFFITNGYPPWQSFYHEALAFLAFVCLCIFFITNKKLKITWFALLLVFLCFISLSFNFFLDISYFFKGDIALSFLYLSIFFLVTVGFSNLSHSVSTSIVEKLMLALCLFGLFFAYLAFYQWLNFDCLNFWVLAIGDSVYGNLGQPNLFASSLLITVLAFIGLFLNRMINIYVFSFSLLLLLMAVVLTQSKAAYLNFLIVSLSTFVYSVRFMSYKKACQLFILLICLFSVSFYLVDFLDRFLLLSDDEASVQNSFNARIDIWRQMINALWVMPINGYGWLHTSIAQVQPINLGTSAIMTYYAHNIILDLLLWNGWFVGGCIVIVCFVWGYLCLRSISTVNDWFCFVLVCVLVVHAMVEFPLYYLFFLLPFSIAVGYLERYSSAVFFISVTAFKSYLLVIFLLAGFIAKEYIVLENYFREVRLYKVFRSDAVSPPNIYLLDQISEHIEYIEFEPFSGMTDLELEWCKRIVIRHPFQNNWVKYISALVINNKHSEALQAFNMLSVVPNHSLNKQKSLDMAIKYFDSLAENNIKYKRLLDDFNQQGSKKPHR